MCLVRLWFRWIGQIAGAKAHFSLNGIIPRAEARGFHLFESGVAGAKAPFSLNGIILRAEGRGFHLFDEIIPGLKPGASTWPR